MTRRALVLVAALPWPFAVSAAGPSRIEQYLQAVQQQLPPQPAAALDRIDGTPRKLLATRGYLRSAERLLSRWSWSQEQIDRYEASAEYQALLAEIRFVQARFASISPGYELYANTEVRSLDLQLERWNSNPSVTRVAQHLNDAAVAELNTRSYSARPDAASARKFAQFLSHWATPSPVPLASPGLSLHGQARAIDFQIMKDGRIVAGTEVSSVDALWSKQGWGRKLQDAVQGTHFRGPLASPNEPWHYEYQP